MKDNNPNRISRKELFKRAAATLRSELESSKQIPHSGEKGLEAEVIFRNFLSKHLPKRFDVSAGFVLDDSDNVSPQTDVIIYDAYNCPVLEAYDRNLIIPADNVPFVVEVKSHLTKKEIFDAAEKISEIKKLKKTLLPSMGPQGLGTFGAVFAFESKITLSKAHEHYRETILKHGLENHIDYICILDTGIINTLLQLREDKNPSPLMLSSGFSFPPGSEVLTGGVKQGSKTLDTFMRLLLTPLTFFAHRVAHPGFDMSPEAENPTEEDSFAQTIWKADDNVK